LVAEPGAHYVSAMIIIACGKALSETRKLQGHGRSWVWYDDAVRDKEYVWDWSKIKEALLETRKLPRNNTDFKTVLARWDHSKWNNPEYMYVSKEILDVLDEAREHVTSGADDWTAAKMATRFLEPLFPTAEERERFTLKDEPEPGWPQKSADLGDYWDF